MPHERVQYKLKHLCNRRFEDYSVDVIGKAKSDGSFELTNKWGFTQSSWLENREAYMHCGIKQKEGHAALEINLRPNIIFTILFYAALLMLVLELCHIKILPFQSMVIRIAILVFLQLLTAFFIFRVTTSLRTKFERLMQLN